jgi:6-phosphofructokinase 1
LAFNRGHTPVAIHNGFAGLMAGTIRSIDRMEIDSLVVEGGSAFGTNRIQPGDDLGLCAFQLQKHNIQALLVIGGFEAFTALAQLAEARKTYPAFCIPMALLPATISNNVPGTELSLGSDTALNVIIEACDRIRQSAFSSRKRVFVVEVQGGNCGFLATLAALECGATCAYIPEIGIDLRMVARDCSHLIRQFRTGENQGRVILRNENASDTYTTEVISSIFREEGKGVFDSRTAVLGHTQQGGQIAPMDRVRATRLAVNAVHWFEQLTFPGMLEKHSRRATEASINDAADANANASLVQFDGGDPLLASSPVSPVLFAKNHNYHNQHHQQRLTPEDNPQQSAPAAAVLDETRLFEPSRSQCIQGGSFTSDPCSVGVIGVHGTNTFVTPVQALSGQVDFKKRTTKHVWWKHLNGLVRVLAKYGFQNPTYYGA